MGIIPEKKEYKNFTYDNYLLFTDKIQEKLGYTKVTHTPYNARNHFDKFGFLDKGKKVVVVYDTKARMLTLTASDKSMKALSGAITPYVSEVKTEKKSDKKQRLGQNSVANPTNEKTDKKNITKEKTNPKKEEKQQKKTRSEHNKSAEKNQKRAEQKDIKKSEQKSPKLEKKQKKQEKEKLSVKKQQEKPVAVVQEKVLKESIKTSFETKNRSGIYLIMTQYYPLSFNKAMHRARNTDGVVIKTLRTLNFGQDSEQVRYEVVRDNKTGFINYLPKKGEVEICGEIISEIKDIFLLFGGTLVAQSTNANSDSGKYEFVLSSHLDAALKYLSSQEKNDIGSGLDELNRAKDHYEYSMFLLSPFKGLENFIFDLQKSKNIFVKMIGQAYDKDENGSYVLKETFRNRCGIVLSEVLSALYSEYYLTRNYYTHTGDNGAHKIKSKKQALKVIGGMLDVIEYNCKKLSEIGYELSR